jgi:ribosome biogenesis GTPase A
MMNPENAAALCIMEHIARKRGCIKKGSDIDYEKCAACILDDFREGKIGTISLERP